MRFDLRYKALQNGFIICDTEFGKCGIVSMLESDNVYNVNGSEMIKC